MYVLLRMVVPAACGAVEGAARRQARCRNHGPGGAAAAARRALCCAPAKTRAQRCALRHAARGWNCAAHLEDRQLVSGDRALRLHRVPADYKGPRSDASALDCRRARWAIAHSTISEASAANRAPHCATPRCRHMRAPGCARAHLCRRASCHCSSDGRRSRSRSPDACRCARVAAPRRSGDALLPPPAPTWGSSLGAAPAPAGACPRSGGALNRSTDTERRLGRLGKSASLSELKPHSSAASAPPSRSSPPAAQSSADPACERRFLRFDLRDCSLH
jgi:hypothetical protein